MDVRRARRRDADAIADIARHSIALEYPNATDEEPVPKTLEVAYSTESILERIENEMIDVFVIEADGTIVGVAEVSGWEKTDTATIRWLHVHPDHRGESVIGEIITTVEASLFDRNVDRIEARVMAGNETIAGAFEAAGYEAGPRRERTVGESTVEQQIFVKSRLEQVVPLVEPRSTEVGTIYIALDERRQADPGTFYAAYTDGDRNHRYGFYCDNCGSVDVVMDSMGKLECQECHNSSKPTRWDAAQR